MTQVGWSAAPASTMAPGPRIDPSTLAPERTMAPGSKTESITLAPASTMQSTSITLRRTTAPSTTFEPGTYTESPTRTATSNKGVRTPSRMWVWASMNACGVPVSSQYELSSMAKRTPSATMAGKVLRSIETRSPKAMRSRNAGSKT